MNARMKVAYTTDLSTMAKFSDLDCVVTISDLVDRRGTSVPKGSGGTIVAVWGDGTAYEVEFFEPIQALLTARPEDLKRDDP